MEGWTFYGLSSGMVRTAAVRCRLPSLRLTCPPQAGAGPPPAAPPSPRSLRPWPPPTWKRCGRKATSCAPRGGGRNTIYSDFDRTIDGRIIQRRRADLAEGAPTRAALTSCCHGSAVNDSVVSYASDGGLAGRASALVWLRCAAFRAGMQTGVTLDTPLAAPLT